MLFKEKDEERLDRRLGLEEINSVLERLGNNPNEYPIFSLKTNKDSYLGIITEVVQKRKYVYITISQASGTKKAKVPIKDFKDGKAWLSTMLSENPEKSGFILKKDGKKIESKKEITKSTILAKEK